jgi:hypothetical protein
MPLVIALSVVFLLSPVLGYILISADLPLERKIIIGAVGALILTVMPLLVLLLAGGGS